MQGVFFRQFVLLALLSNSLDLLERTFLSLQKRPFRPFRKNFFVPLKETVQTLQKELFCPFERNRLDPLERTFLSLQKGPFRPFRKNFFVPLEETVQTIQTLQKNILVSLKNYLDPLERTFLSFRKYRLGFFQKEHFSLFKKLFRPFRKNFFVLLDGTLVFLNLLDYLYKKTPMSQPLFYYQSFKVQVQFITVYYTNNINAILKNYIFLLHNVNTIFLKNVILKLTVYFCFF